MTSASRRPCRSNALQPGWRSAQSCNIARGWRAEDALPLSAELGRALVADGIPGRGGIKHSAMSSIQEKVIVITGASSGIGEATARLLAERGAHVVVGARRTERLEKLVAEITAKNGSARFRAVDVTSREDTQSLVDFAKSEFGRELLPNGRYDEARGSKRSAYQGRYVITGNHIDYVDDTGFTADGDFVDGVLHHAGMILRREN